MRFLERRLHPHLNRYSLRYVGFVVLIVYLLAVALWFASPVGILRGFAEIIGRSDRLLTDYMASAGMGTAFANAALMTGIHLLILHKWRLHLRSQHIAAILTLMGFSFFGKNPVNWLPLFLGVVSYAWFRRESAKEYATRALFVSALGPLVAECRVQFDAFLQPYAGRSGAVVLSVLLAALVGWLAGFVFSPLSESFVRFHQGFSLYNAGFAAGILAMIANATFRAFGIEIQSAEILVHGQTKALACFLLLWQVGVILVGSSLDRRAWARYRQLLRTTGVNQHGYVQHFGAGATLINSGMLGLLGTGYVLLVGGELNGPVLGAICTMMGFAFIGKNLWSAIPILLGVYLASLLHLVESNSTTAILAALFGTTLCPLSGYFGFLPGVFAGFLHMMLIVSVGSLNSGLNLYHNGFSGGFVAAILVPIYYAIGIRHRIPHALDFSYMPPETYWREDDLTTPLAHTPAAQAAEAVDEAIEEEVALGTRIE